MHMPLGHTLLFAEMHIALAHWIIAFRYNNMLHKKAD